MSTEPMYQTPSGVAIPLSDLRQIRKDVRRDTVIKILAGIGAITLVSFLYSLRVASQASSGEEE